MSVHVKPGVLFTVIAPGGFRILAAIDTAARIEDLTITSACDGEHSGLDDPHHRGEAYDVRSHDLINKQRTLEAIMACFELDKFFGFIEDSGTDNEHIHIQVKKGTLYP